MAYLRLPGVTTTTTAAGTAGGVLELDSTVGITRHSFLEISSPSNGWVVEVLFVQSPFHVLARNADETLRPSRRSDLSAVPAGATVRIPPGEVTGDLWSDDIPPGLAQKVPKAMFAVPVLVGIHLDMSFTDTTVYQDGTTPATQFHYPPDVYLDYSDGSSVFHDGTTFGSGWSVSGNGDVDPALGYYGFKHAGTFRLAFTYQGYTAYSDLVTSIGLSSLVLNSLGGSLDPLIVGTTNTGFLQAHAVFTDATVQDINVAYTDFICSDVSVATIVLGTVTPVATGLCDITGTIQGFTTPPVAVRVQTAVSIDLTPHGPITLKGPPIFTEELMTITATLDDTSVVDVTTQCGMHTDNACVQVYAAGGVVTLETPGTANVTAVMGPTTSNIVVFTCITLTSLVGTPNPANVVHGNDLQLTATGHYSDLSTRNDTASCLWQVADLTKATIGLNTGLLHGVAVGATTAVGSWGAISTGAITVNVT